MSSETGGIDFTVKTRKDKYFDELKQLAKTIEVADVQLVVAEKNRGTFKAFETQEETNIQNKYELAKKVESDIIEIINRYLMLKKMK